MRKYLPVSFVIFFVVFPAIGMCQSINWKRYDPGMAMARQENKKVFLHFKSQRCSWCYEMEEKVFSDSSVIEYLNTHFINVLVDGDIEPNLREQYNVKGYPDNRFLNETAEQVFSVFAVLRPAVFKFFLEYIQTDSYKTMTVNEYFKTRGS